MKANYQKSLFATDQAGSGAAVLILLLCLQVTITFGEDVVANDVDNQTRQALLAGNWERVYESLGTEESHSPIVRLVKAHACLALSRNNESACLLQEASANDLHLWSEWTSRFVAEHPGNATAAYLSADALARQGKWDEATQKLDSVISAEPGAALALNMRGVIEAGRTNYPAAEIDFDAAVRAMPSLADAWCNSGMLAIQQEEGASGALEDFTKALGLSSEFATAMYGRGCMELALCQWTNAQADLNSSLVSDPCLKALLAANMTAAGGLDRRPQQAGKPGDTNAPGMQLMAEVNQFSSGDWGFQGSALKAAFQNNASNPRDLLMTYQAAKVAVANNPSLGPYLDNYWGQSKNAVSSMAVLSQSVSSAQATANLSMSSRIPGAQFGGGLSSSLSQANTYNYPNALTQYKTYNDNFQTVNNQLLQRYGSAPSGFDGAQHDAILDSAHWPYVPVYGLFLNRNSAAPSASVSQNSK